MNIHAPLPYFPRAPLDTECLGHIGLGKGVSMFAPRRRGKTSFVEHELIPAAQNNGFHVIYVDLWTREKTPEIAIVDALEAYSGKTNFRVTSAKIKAGVRGAGLEAGAEVTGSTPPGESDLLTRLFSAFDRIRGTTDVLLVIDEFQALANCQEPGFVAALRSHIQRLPRLKVFFTGSSRRELSNMLSTQSAPFLGMTMPVPLPELGRAFVEDRCAIFFERTGRTIDIEAMAVVFKQLVLVPEYLNQVLGLMIVRGIYDPAAGYEAWKDAMLEQGEGSKLWSTLSELDQQIILLLNHAPARPMFAKATLDWLSDRLPGENITAGRMQTALQRLVRNGVLEQGQARGEYEVGHDDLRVFVSHLKKPKLPGQSLRRRTRSR